jgi:hypothetical protein
MRILTALAAMFLGLAAFAPSSQASTVTYDVTFSANKFLGGTPNLPTELNSKGKMVPTLEGSFTISFDPTQGYHNNTTAITDFHINIPSYSKTLTAFSYTSFLFGTGAIGGGSHTALHGVDFRIGFTLAGLINVLTFQELGSHGHYKQYTALFPTFTVTPATAPIPASVLMMLTALGTLGGFGYLRGRKAQPEAVSLAA